MKTGKIYKNAKGVWVVKYDNQVVKNCFGCKPYDTFKQLPILNQTEQYEEGSIVYFNEVEDGKYVEIVSPLEFLANQAQELDMGYVDGWTNIFKEIEDSLNSPLPNRVKNWLRNKYHSPVLK